MPTGPEHTLRFIAFGLGALAALAAAFELRDAVAPEPQARPAQADPLRTELIRCRTITPEELTADTACQSAWAENRRRFFAPTRGGGQTREEE